MLKSISGFLLILLISSIRKNKTSVFDRRCRIKVNNICLKTSGFCEPETFIKLTRQTQFLSTKRE